MNYITSADITHVHLKQFPSETIQPYVDEANTHYIDIALQKGIMQDQITSATPIVVNRCLSNYVVMRFAEDSIGSNGVEVSDDDMYVKMSEKFSVVYEDLLKQLTPELIMGVSNNSQTARSVSTGKLNRTN